MEKIRLEFEDWYSKQKFDQIATWHPAEALEFQHNRYPHGRYTLFSQKQTCWEVWQSAFVKAQELAQIEQTKKNNVCEIVDGPGGVKVKVCYTVVPLAPHNSIRNHVDAEVETEQEAKSAGIECIPAEEGEFLTAEQILEYMLKNMRGEDIIEILKVEKESDMIAFHSSVGRWIRNTFKLWHTDNPHLDGTHPDEMSFEILKGIWRTIQRREMIGL